MYNCKGGQSAVGCEGVSASELNPGRGFRTLSRVLCADLRSLHAVPHIHMLNHRAGELSALLSGNAAAHDRQPGSARLGLQPHQRVAQQLEH